MRLSFRMCDTPVSIAVYWLVVVTSRALRKTMSKYENVYGTQYKMIAYINVPNLVHFRNE